MEAGRQSAARWKREWEMEREREEETSDLVGDIAPAGTGSAWGECAENGEAPRRRAGLIGC